MLLKYTIVGSFILLLNILVLNPSTAYVENLGRLNEQVIMIDNTMSLVEQKEANSYGVENLDNDIIQTVAIINQNRITGLSIFLIFYFRCQICI